MVDLQSQLRSVSEQRESGVVPQTAPPAYGGRGRGYVPARGRGRGAGSYAQYSQYPASQYPTSYTGRGSSRGRFSEDSRGWGRGRFGGRAAAGGNPGYMTIDNRTRSLVVSQPPEGLDSSALEHFSR
jgi:hypothetical protein